MAWLAPYPGSIQKWTHPDFWDTCLDSWPIWWTNWCGKYQEGMTMLTLSTLGISSCMSRSPSVGHLWSFPEVAAWWRAKARFRDPCSCSLRLINWERVSCLAPPKTHCRYFLAHVKPCDFLRYTFPVCHQRADRGNALRQEPFGKWNRGVKSIEWDISGFQVGIFLKPWDHVLHYFKGAWNIVDSWFSLGLSSIGLT